MASVERSETFAKKIRKKGKTSEKSVDNPLPFLKANDAYVIRVLEENEEREKKANTSKEKDILNSV